MALLITTVHANEPELVASGLTKPWGLDFLDDGSVVVTELPGRVWKIGDGRKTDLGLRYSESMTNLLDVAADGKNLYLTIQTPLGLDLLRAELTGSGMRNISTIFRAAGQGVEPRLAGGRLLLIRRDTLLVSVGDHGTTSEAQDPSSPFGKLVRIDHASSSARATTVALGIRNVQGLAHCDGKVCFTDHGDVGNDTFNWLEDGGNYGWPNADSSSAPTPIRTWTPAIAPSALAFHQGTAFIASLNRRSLLMIQMARGALAQEEALLDGLQKRLRTVKVHAGHLYLLTDDGLLLRTPVPAFQIGFDPSATPPPSDLRSLHDANCSG